MKGSLIGSIEDVLHGKGSRLLCRKVQELSGEIVGLQDVLSEAGAEEVSQAKRMRELDTQLRQQRQQLRLVCVGTSPDVCSTQWRPYCLMGLAVDPDDVKADI